MNLYEIGKIATAIDTLISSGKRGVLVTVAGTKGSTYRRAGARCVIGEDGSSFGAISGGCVERDLAERMATWLADMKARVITYDTTAADDVVFGLGLGCRGTIEMIVQPFDRHHRPMLPQKPGSFLTSVEHVELVEHIEHQRRVAIFGNGADVPPVANLVKAMGWVPDVVTTREFEIGEWDAAVVMTHNFLRDVAIVDALLHASVPYVGLLGPKSRGDEIVTQIANVTPDMRARLFSPIGLDLGGDSPEEIALSIVAEIQSVLNRKGANPLREKDGPIHEAEGAASCTAGR